MSHRTQPEPRWVRELAERVLGPARYQLPSRVTDLVRAAATEHETSPDILAVRIAKIWAEQGHIPDWRLPGFR